tara:strand:- start:140 stop:604 length:465 start_codon:yes stop_codon:yes gene_type:complete
MSLYDGTLNVVEPFEVIEAVHTLVSESENIVVSQGIESASHVFLHRMTDPHPKKFIIVRQASRAGGELQSISGREIVLVQVEVSIHDDQGNPHKFLNAIHQRVFQAIVNQKPAMTRNTLELPFSREALPSPPDYDDQTKEWFSTALYYAVVKPI